MRANVNYCSLIKNVIIKWNGFADSILAHGTTPPHNFLYEYIVSDVRIDSFFAKDLSAEYSVI